MNRIKKKYYDNGNPKSEYEVNHKGEINKNH
jgi:hypothetical protein